MLTKSPRGGSMNRYTWILAIGIALLIIMMCTWGILLNVNNTKCAMLVFPSFADMMNGWNNYMFNVPNSRYVAEAVVASKLVDVPDFSLDITKLSDIALYGIITSTILVDNRPFIDVLNNPKYLDCVRNYDPVAKKFRGLKNDAITILSTYDPLAKDKLDYAIYSTLTNGK